MTPSDSLSQLYEPYGCAMYQAQLLELNIRGLFQLRGVRSKSGLDCRSLDETMTDLFKRPLAKVAGALEIPST
jgi:hypothetical protein